MKITNFKKHEWETLRKLHGLKKIQHIIFYYKIHISLFLGILILSIILIYTYIENSIPPRLYFSLFTDSSTDYAEWAKGLIARLPEGSGTVEWMQIPFFTPSSPSIDIDKNYISTRLGVNEMDIIISTSTLYNYMQELDCILPLDLVFDEEQLTDYHDVLGISDSAEGTGIYAVRLAPSQFPGAKKEPYYLYICSTTQHIADATAMFQIILHETDLYDSH